MRMACVHVVCVVLTIFLFLCCVCNGVEQKQVNIPPLIIEQPPRFLAFVVGESIELKCVASGQPSPEYRWERNDRNFSVSGNDDRVFVKPGVGSLIFAKPTLKDAGFYKCFARNHVGIAITDVIYLLPARLDRFPVRSARRYSPELGEALTLRCVPPSSYPIAMIFWGTISKTHIHEPVLTSDRVTIDPEGNLLFANVIASDANGGRPYVCIAQNRVMRKVEIGAHSIISPRGQTVLNIRSTITWAPHSNQIALRGKTLSMKCIFSGRPTPRVDWVRLRAPMSPSARTESYGQELVIDNVQFDDAGTYQCSGINTEASSAVRRSFNVAVESAPYWLPGKRPESVHASVGDTAVFYCETHGVPAVEYAWFLNGKRIEKVVESKNHLLDQNKLTFLNVTQEDSVVIQCNATNKHGNVFANAYLSVLAEPPMIQSSPEVGQKAAEGQTITLKCTVFGSPKPLVTWHKDKEQLTGGRYKVTYNGDLLITNVSLVDAGTYTCSATNNLGEMSATGSLIVRRKTLIQMAPHDMIAVGGTEAKFTCTAITDPEEAKNLKIDWKKGDELIDYKLAQRIFKNHADNSLTIYGLYILDTGKYTCVASNGIDTAEANAQLLVQAPPSEPINIFVECFNSKKKARVSWKANRANYAPILSYSVQYNTTFTPDAWVDYNDSVPQNIRTIEANLSAWTNYTFRVLARNKIGMSVPSRHSTVMCTTEEDVPDKNPEHVIGEGDQPNNLVIFWTPMPGIEQNGPSFSYIITWKRDDIANAELHTARVDRPDAWHYVVPVRQETYKPYVISVKATNVKGEARVPPKTVIGYSGEDVPLVRPNDVAVDENSIGATTANITWTAVDTSPERMRGFFRGYRVQFGKTSEWPKNVREQDFIVNQPKQYPRSITNGTVSYLLTNLPANTSFTLHVRVLTKFYAGPSSDVLEFETKEAAEPPMIQIPPEVGQKAADGQTITLKCTVFGLPKPLVIWHKEKEQLTEGRYYVMYHGDLRIMFVSMVDTGTYTCSAKNKLGEISATGSLIVRRKTLIQMAPHDTIALVGTEAKFTCTAMTDPEEEKNLKIDWKKDDDLIDYKLTKRVYKNYADNSLTISGLNILDTGKYTCVASNGIDTAEANAQLLVQAPPSEPINILVKCVNSEKKARVSWEAGSTNYAPILSYSVQYNTTFAPDAWVDYIDSVPSYIRTIEADLSAWTKYTFRVLARNKFGLSEPSRHSTVMCTTDEDVPDKNPEHVIGEGDQPNNLVIFWTPMPRIDQNGPTFSYIITWKRDDIANAELHTARVDRPDAWHYVVPERQETYKPYEISVKASNAKGEARVPPKTVIGYSGEDVPLVRPNDVAVDENSIGATTANITWTAVDTSPERMRGFFRGYRVQFGTTSEWPKNVREQDFIVNQPKQYPRARMTRSITTGAVRYLLTNLTANTSFTLHVRVLNKYYVGPPSDVLEFETKEAAEPPMIQIPPEVGQKAAVGQTITLKCIVFGLPKPLVIWHKGKERLTGGRHIVMYHGDLRIMNVSLVDTGTYTCSATNKLGEMSATGSLIVRRKTLIQMVPQDTMAVVGTEAKFTCTAMTDPEEAKNLKIDWKKDDELIDYKLAQRIFKNHADNSLTISGLNILDTGNYTCVASNGIDTAEANAQLVVQAPPSEPTHIFVECINSNKKARVTWEAGNENYAPILSFSVQYNTTFAPNTWVDYNDSVPQNLRSIEADLSAWTNYTFRVLARNKIGLSEPSRHSIVMCTTEEDVPDKNPENVIGEGDQPNNLVIFWTPMPGIDQNGPTFSYIITWKRDDIANAELHTTRVDRPDAWHYVVPERQETYKPYEISVKATNVMGEARVPPKTVIGYSGEDVPLVRPNDVAVDENSIGATTANITWTAVDTSPERMRGFFRGYRVQFGKTSEWPQNVREQDFIVNQPKQHPRARMTRSITTGAVRYLLTNLTANTPFTLHVRVLNKYYVGPPSDVLEFGTNEGDTSTAKNLVTVTGSVGLAMFVLAIKVMAYSIIV